ncbi:myeloid leukemia factor 2 [Ambystoma mexicanum]|uniref:myeloid leukemia factor 2 n=1 Tax=Ambystoma mexicanum TaxID=8296 RepID=UPI0037E8F336
MFRLMRDAEPEDPAAMFLMDPFAMHQQQMNRMLSGGLGGFGFSPFLPLTDGGVLPGTARPTQAPVRRVQPGALAPFGAFPMGGGIADMFGMMNNMMGNMSRMPACQSYSSSTFVSYSNMSPDGTPKVYQETSQMRAVPGGVRETRRTVRDSSSGLEQMSIGHHIRERGHVMQRSRNHRTGDQEEQQDYINLEESEAPAFNEEFQREVGRFRPHQRGGAARRRSALEGAPLAIQGPDALPSGQARRYDW